MIETVKVKARRIVVCTLPAEPEAGDRMTITNTTGAPMEIVQAWDRAILASLDLGDEAKVRAVWRWSWRRFRRVPTWVAA